MKETIVRGALPQVRWGPIWTGALVGVAFLITLGLFGSAIGLGGAPTVGVIWGLLVPFAATFIGAYVASRMASADSTASFLNGLAVWCMVLVAGAFFVALSPGVMANMGSRYAFGPSIPMAGMSAGIALLAGISAFLALIGGVVGSLLGRRSLTAHARTGEFRREYVERETTAEGYHASPERPEARPSDLPPDTRH